MTGTNQHIVVYSSSFCPYCSWAKRLLKNKKVKYEERSVDGDRNLRSEMEKRSGRSTVPQIFIGSTHVGGYDDMAALDRKGELDKLLFPVSA